MNNQILIVDDDVVARDGVAAILMNEDYQLETAGNGKEAVEKAAALSPDVILLDVMMPEMDGFEVCRRIRAIPEIAEVPIILLTALDDQQSLLRGFEAGADDFLTKPVNRHELRARIGTILRLNRYRRLLQERARIRELVNQIINLQEEERRLIAQELHDEVGQSLTTLAISLKLLLDDLPDEQQSNRVQEMLDITTNTIDQLRHLGHELRPPALDLVGLGPTLEGFCRAFSRRTQLPVLFKIDGQVPGLINTYNITLYRFLQEALTNVAKHACASQAWVKLSVESAGIRLSVRDDGRGFSQEFKGEVNSLTGEPDTPAGMGLLGMRERVALLNGRLEIASQPGQGSQIATWLPLPAGVAHD